MQTEYVQSKRDLRYQVVSESYRFPSFFGDIHIERSGGLLKKAVILITISPLNGNILIVFRQCWIKLL